MLRLFFFALSSWMLIWSTSCQTSGSQGGKHPYTNALIDESSPYLLQHAHNPVNWHPWGEKALEEAKKSDKLLLISIGYAACHWCHVMEEESFEDTAVARIMNEYFIPIKVDREERPDVDDIYMTACQMSSDGSCGWPLNSFALPDGRPVWAGTYYPKKQWVEILEYFIKTYREDREKLETYADQLKQGLQTVDALDLDNQEASYSQEAIQQVTRKTLAGIDFSKGGRKGAPKFPVPVNFEYLLHYYYLSKDEKALEAVTVTLDNIARGGIYDHLGGGFARYATDENWKVPHFEKMLYDNAQLISLYAKAYQVTKKPLYRQVAEESLDFALREWQMKEGGFYASFDADSEGEEGKYYVWSKTEIEQALADAVLVDLFCDYFEVTDKGNWEESKNILYRKKDLADVAKKHQLTVEQAEEMLQKAKKLLLEKRSARTAPGLDDKTLCSWNALMLTAFVDAYKAFGEVKHLDHARQLAAFLTQSMMQNDSRLNRNYKDGKSSINAFLDDYALTITAFVDLYEASFDEKWLFEAQNLLDYVHQHFYDAATGLCFYTSDLDPPLVIRKKEIGDNVIPSSNSVLARAALRLGYYLYRSDYLEWSERALQAVWPQVEASTNPDYFSNWCALYLERMKPPYEVAIVGKDFAPLHREMMQHYLPDVLYLGGANEGSLELLKGKWRSDMTQIYVCQNKVCQLPVQEVSRALDQLR
ncbi:MAG TPA: thioredoxin domain-containing protein [Saprospiraceae bacterium]|nr:thioredoxin domain-containing protein [Saprospiraceae bacterium]HMQ84071.1 thioredoxin domain-containing protein [Saprospiraceae bacterium]